MTIRISLFFSLLVVLLAACSPEYAALDIRLLTTPPDGADIRDTRIELPAGNAALIRVSARNSKGRDYDENTVIVLDSEDLSIFRANPTDRERDFVIVGQKPGETCMQVYVEDVLEDCIPVTIISP